MLKKLIVISVFVAIAMAKCPNDEYCLSCKEGKCEACQDSYADAEGVCKEPTSKIDKCRGYKDATTCESCDYGYNASSDGKKCEKLEDGCDLYIEDITGCAVCSDQIAAESGKCGTAKCTATNCNRCLLSAFCIECNEGYSVSGATSMCIKEPVENCWMTQADATKCELCRPGYYDTDTECKKSSKTSTLGANLVSVIVLSLVGLIYA